MLIAEVCEAIVISKHEGYGRKGEKEHRCSGNPYCDTQGNSDQSIHITVRFPDRLEQGQRSCAAGGGENKPAV